MKGFVGAILLIIGVINIISGSSGLLIWLAVIAGVVMLASSLSGPHQKHRSRVTSRSAGIYSSTNSYDSDCSGSSGDCGGGGGD
ncbi:hypothetical protein ACSLBF_15530 [Pseudoalteromonas sp. T1lg65]|uniref:hypothetical protein n=1 Tax=Pseudoalteromonas sp. T1lg65 TaxID=2077101 RepID=UPI003F797C48